jgi:GNAT superfamily N-acetyltransferase
MDTIRIRPAQATDLNVLVSLLRQLFAIEADFTFDPVRQRRGLELMLEDRLRRMILVADAAGEVVGMATGQMLVSTAEGASSVLVEDVVVAAGLRGRGIGRSLVTALVEWARGRGSTRVTLLADRGNEAALRFYERLGWRGTRMIALHRALR